MKLFAKNGEKAPLRGMGSKTYVWSAGAAGVGAMLGHAINRRGPGAAIGGAIGGLIGGMAGAWADRKAGH